MKRYVHIILISILPIISFAQSDSTIFAPVGAEWWHGNLGLQSQLAHNFSINSKSVQDTIINNREAIKINLTKYTKIEYTNEKIIDTIELEPIYIANTIDTVFIYNTYFNDFTPLYVFNVEDGDTLCLPVIPHPFIETDFSFWYNPIAEKDSFFCIKVDSVRMVSYDGEYLKTVFTREIIAYNNGILFPGYNFSQGHIDANHYEPYNKNGYAQKLGSLSISFFPTPVDLYAAVGGSLDTSAFKEFEVTGFRCYQDDNININLYPEGGDCDYISSVNIKEQQNNPLSINIYPNPANEKVHIKTGDFSREGNIKIYDNLGRLRLESRLLNKENTLDISKLNSGVYYLKITIDEQEYTEKLILEKR